MYLPFLYDRMQKQRNGAIRACAHRLRYHRSSHAVVVSRVLHKLICRHSGLNEVSQQRRHPQQQPSDALYISCFSTEYPHMWRSRTQTGIKKFPAGKGPTPQVWRQISWLSRLMTLFARIRVQCSSGKQQRVRAYSIASSRDSGHHAEDSSTAAWTAFKSAVRALRPLQIHICWTPVVDK